MTSADDADDSTGNGPTIGDLRGFIKFLGAFREVKEQQARAIDVDIENRIYENAALETPDRSIPLSSAYHWAVSIDGSHNIDIPHDEIPDDVCLSECDVVIRSSDGVPLFVGEITSVGRVDGLGGNTTVITQPTGLR